MRVTFVTNKLDMSKGGVNFSLNAMARSLSKRGHDVKVLVVNPNKTNPPENPLYKIYQAEDRRLGTRLGVFRRTYKMLKNHEDDTDIYHIFNPILASAAGLYRRRGGETPCVGRLNGYTMFCVNRSEMDGICHINCGTFQKFKHQNANIMKKIGKIPFYTVRTHIESELYTELDIYFAISPAVKEIYAEHGIPRENIAIVPNFFDPELGANIEEVPVSRVSTDYDLNVLYVGRLVEEKDVDLLIKAVSNLDSICLSVVGKGPLKSDLVSLTEELGISERVNFVGYIKNRKLPSYYRQHDVFVHPATVPEPAGRTILETMQCGTPAVVSDIGGPPWIVGDTGLTFPPGDLEALVDILADLRDTPAKLDELADRCSTNLQRFAPQTVVDEIEKEYQHARNPT